MSNTEKVKKEIGTAPKETVKQDATPNTSLCEDMNGHKFDEASFNKLSNEQSNLMKNQK